MGLRGAGGAQYLVPTKSNLQHTTITSGLQVSPVPSEIHLCMGVEPLVKWPQLSLEMLGM